MPQVVQQVSRLARSFDGPAIIEERQGNIRVARQLGPAGPPGPYRYVTILIIMEHRDIVVFRYGYAVQDDIGNDFNKQETSDGGVVTGQYSVLLPDGRIQTVTYSVAPNTGFVVSNIRGGIMNTGLIMYSDISRLR